ncbi:MAG: hypothetical protein ACEQSC_00935 [Candidatus Nanopelagicaceae bacterium]
MANYSASSSLLIASHRMDAAKAINRPKLTSATGHQEPDILHPE